MPIYESCGSTVYHFGHGDIFIGCAADEPGGVPCELVFNAGPNGEIGRSGDEYVGKRTDEIGAKVRFRFDGVASLDVLIQQATDLRRQMIEGQSPNNGVTGVTTAGRNVP